MAKDRAARAQSTAQDIWSNPYLRRFVDDADLRDNVRVAYDNARSAYGRLNNGKPTGKQLLDDKKLHRDLQRTADALRDANSSLRESPKKRKGGIGKLLLLTVVGAVAALALSEGLRNKALDALFGAEEEFDYTSTTTPATPPPAPSVSQPAGDTT